MQDRTITVSDRYIEKHGEARSLLAEIEEKVMAMPVPGDNGFTPDGLHVIELETLIRRLRFAGDEFHPA